MIKQQQGIWQDCILMEGRFLDKIYELLQNLQTILTIKIPNFKYDFEIFA